MDKESIDALHYAFEMMRYVLSAPQLSTVIPGMKSKAEVDMNIVYSDGAAFPAELAAQLPSHNWPRNFYT